MRIEEKRAMAVVFLFGYARNEKEGVSVGIYKAMMRWNKEREVSIFWTKLRPPDAEWAV